MRSTELQLLVTLAAVLAAAGIFASRGLPPSGGLFIAAIFGDLAEARGALDWGCPVDPRDVIDATPLHHAADHGQKKIAKLLVTRGAAIDAKDLYGQTPAVWATQSGHPEVAELLRQHGAKE